ncbi:hypothetical protein CTEN210_13566 [Chaetoceros tenuissimus]|uniref:PNPLA domain-containing protein n=1 Tax=Chaetoceros tenuissimus TaxID=426638 RepID=A0AAD3D5F1_9STRA|nr:hypothetical protein CTEN210_13566 [Chaetoceros tenuissimus]
MSTSKNRKSTVGWISKGFNAGNQKALDDLVQKSQRKLSRVQTSSLSASTTSISALTYSSEDNPINIIVFDGGGMKVVSTVALIEEIEKIANELGFGQDWLSRFDLIAGSSAGGITSLMACHTKSTSSFLEVARGLIEEMAAKAFSKLKILNIFTECEGLDRQNQFDNVVMDFLKEDVPTKNDDGLKAFALCAARKINDPEGEMKPFLLRTYDLPKEVEAEAMDGTSSFTVPKAIHSTSALPGIVRRFKTYYKKEAISLADGGFISTAPIAEAIMEAELLYPSRKLGVVMAIGLDSGNDRSSYQAIDIARINNPNIHFHRIVPEEALQGHSPTDSDLDKYAELTAKTKKFIRDSPREQLLLGMTLKKLFEGPSRRPNLNDGSGVKRRSFYEAPALKGILKKDKDLRASRAAMKVGLKDTTYVGDDTSTNKESMVGVSTGNLLRQHLDRGNPKRDVTFESLRMSTVLKFKNTFSLRPSPYLVENFDNTVPDNEEEKDHVSYVSLSDGVSYATMERESFLR